MQQDKTYREAILQILEWMDDRNIERNKNASLTVLLETIEDWAFQRGLDSVPPDANT
jgi:hypothetical protein